MPKKYQHSFSKTNSNYVHPSLGSSSRSVPVAPAAPPTVNERLSQLRLAQASPEATERQRAFAESLNQRSVPPSLGGILGVPESAPPAPKPGYRQPRMRVRTPGPAPPRSWLLAPSDGYRLAPRAARSFGTKSTKTRILPASLNSFLDRVGERTVEPGSLVHVSLRCIAQNWDDVVEDVLEYLTGLPQHLRVTLLSYLATYGPTEGIALASLRALVYGNEGLSCLDLSSLVGWGFGLKGLNACLTKPPPAESDTQQHSALVDVADSWDAEGIDEQGTLTIPRTLVAPAQSSLTKLSLSRPGPGVNWKDLLSITAKLPTLTHLSLAYWPGATETMSANLRQLSRHTYCLRWLDLEGCHWTLALCDHGEQTHFANGMVQYDLLSRGQQAALGNMPEPDFIGPDWSGSWKQLTYLNISQGWHPNTYHEVGQLARTKLEKSFAEWLLKHSEDVNLPQCKACGRLLGSMSDDRRCAACTVYHEQYTKGLWIWAEKESRAEEMASSCRNLRGHSKHGPLLVDCGWRIL